VPTGAEGASIGSSDGEVPDVYLQTPQPARGSYLWTQQSRACSQPGDLINVAYPLLETPPADLGRRLAREITKYRYGVFDEAGYADDPVYPACFRGDATDRQRLTGCSDLPLEADAGMCEALRRGVNVNVSAAVQPSARTSLMFSAAPPQVIRFCDASSHDRLAPTKQNLLCGRRSIMEVIDAHPDFAEADSVANTTSPPITTFTYKRQMLTRYVLVIEDTKDMQVRDSWMFLRTAVRKWVNLDLSGNSEAGLVLVNDSASTRLVGLTSLQSQQARGLVSSNLPYTPGDSHAPACLDCGIREALQMLAERKQFVGPAAQVIVVIAPGADAAAAAPSGALAAAAAAAAAARVAIATINYPAVLRAAPLDSLAAATGAPAFTVPERGHNMASSLLDTYFRLSTAMAAVATRYFQGHPNALPVEIHRRELTDAATASRGAVTGSFVLEEGLGSPARFAVYTYNTENPLLRGVTLVSPSQRVYSTRSETLISLRMLTVAANLNETGTWTYTVERFPGNPQPHVVQVMATPRSIRTPVVRARMWTSKTLPLVLYVEVTRGGSPVLGASVEVVATRPGFNGSAPYREEFSLLDNGGGDPDITKGDGVYSRYFSTITGKAGAYTFNVVVGDNGNTAYTWRDDESEPENSDGACCGSALRVTATRQLVPFQRTLPPTTVYLPSVEEMLASGNAVPAGRVGDLRVEIQAAELKALLSWTAPDLGGMPVARYEVLFATSLSDLVDGFESAARPWTHNVPFPLAPGSKSSFTLDMTRDLSLLDQPFFLAMRAHPEASTGAPPGPMSNWVRVLVPAPPPPPPPPPPTQSQDSDGPLWSQDGADSAVPRLAHGLDIGLELILPVVGGIALLALCLGVYCYLCVLRRSQDSSSKKKKTAAAAAAASGNGNSNSGGDWASLGGSVAVPVSNDSPGLDQKKRLSISEIPAHSSPTSNGAPPLSMTPNPDGTLQRPRTLSPYQSWTASQLLHEHERRHSPYGDEHNVYSIDASPVHHQLPAYQPPQPGYDGGVYAVDGSYMQQHPPPVPPLPHLRYPEEALYGVQQPQIMAPHSPQQYPPAQVAPSQQPSNGYLRNNCLLPFNPSLQGSLSSVSSGDRKKRNVTMV